ncbi:MAG TPA: hypothetical protein VFZ32_07290 [Micromonosporaceae bacterium]
MDRSDWTTYVASVVYAVQFDRQPVDAVDRLMELIVATDVLPGTPEDHLTAVRSALASTVRLAELVPQPHTEGALRKLLRTLEGRLDSWVREGSAVSRVPVTDWSPAGPSPVVAHLAREPEFLSRWLGSPFDQVSDETGELRIAALRLASGKVVALLQVVGNPAPGTSLLQAGAEPPDDVVREFLVDTQLSDSVVEWIAGPAAGQPAP